MNFNTLNAYAGPQFQDSPREGGLSIREYASIHLRHPNSGNLELDQFIKDANAGTEFVTSELSTGRRMVKVQEKVHVPSDGKMGGHWKIVDKGVAEFHGFGAGIEEGNNEFVSYSQAIIEWPDGKVEMVLPERIQFISERSERAPLVRLFEQPLGVRFKYQDGNATWILLDRCDSGKVAKLDGLNFVMQSICTAADSEGDMKELMVHVVPG